MPRFEEPEAEFTDTERDDQFEDSDADEEIDFYASSHESDAEPQLAMGVEDVEEFEKDEEIEDHHEDSVAEPQLAMGVEKLEGVEEIDDQCEDSVAKPQSVMAIGTQSMIGRQPRPPRTTADSGVEIHDQAMEADNMEVATLQSSINKKLYDKDGEISDHWRLKGWPYDDDEVEEGQRHNVDWSKVYSAGLLDIPEPPKNTPDDFVIVGHQRIPRTLFNGQFEGSFEKACEWALTHTLYWPVQQEHSSTDDILAKMLKKKAADLNLIRGHFFQNFKKIEPQNLPSEEKTAKPEPPSEEPLPVVEDPALDSPATKGRKKKPVKPVKPNSFFKQYILGKIGKPVSEVLGERLFHYFNTEDSDPSATPERTAKSPARRRPPIASDDEESEYELPKLRRTSRRKLAVEEDGHQDESPDVVQESSTKRKRKYKEEDSSVAGSPFTPFTQSTLKRQKATAPRAPVGGSMLWDPKNYNKMTVKQLDKALRERGLKPYFRERTKQAFINKLLQDDAKKAAEKAEADRARETAANASTSVLVHRSKEEFDRDGTAPSSPSVTPEAVRQTPRSISPKAQDTEDAPANSSDISPAPQRSRKHQRDSSPDTPHKGKKKRKIHSTKKQTDGDIESSVPSMKLKYRGRDLLSLKERLALREIRKRNDSEMRGLQRTHTQTRFLSGDPESSVPRLYPDLSLMEKYAVLEMRERARQSTQNRESYEDRDEDLASHGSNVMEQKNSIPSTPHQNLMRRPARSNGQNHMAKGRDRISTSNRVGEPARHNDQIIYHGSRGWMGATSVEKIADKNVFQRHRSSPLVASPGGNSMYRPLDMEDTTGRDALSSPGSTFFDVYPGFNSRNMSPPIGQNVAMTATEYGGQNNPVLIDDDSEDDQSDLETISDHDFSPIKQFGLQRPMTYNNGSEQGYSASNSSPCRIENQGLRMGNNSSYSNHSTHSSSFEVQSQDPRMVCSNSYQNPPAQSSSLGVDGQGSRMARSVSNQDHSAQFSPSENDGQIPTMSGGDSKNVNLTQQQYLNFGAPNHMPQYFNVGPVQRNPLNDGPVQRNPLLPRVQNQQPPRAIGNYQPIDNYQHYNVYQGRSNMASVPNESMYRGSTATPNRSGLQDMIIPPTTHRTSDQVTGYGNLTPQPCSSAPQNNGLNFGVGAQGGYGNVNELSGNGSAKMPNGYRPQGAE